MISRALTSYGDIAVEYTILVDINPSLRGGSLGGSIMTGHESLRTSYSNHSRYRDLGLLDHAVSLRVTAPPDALRRTASGGMSVCKVVCCVTYWVRGPFDVIASGQMLLGNFGVLDVSHESGCGMLQFVSGLKLRLTPQSLCVQSAAEMPLRQSARP